MRKQPWGKPTRRDGSPWLWTDFRVAGKRIRLSSGTTDDREFDAFAEKLWIEARRQARQPVPAELARAPVAEVAGTFLNQLEREAVGHREQYATRHRSDVKLYILRREDVPDCPDKWQPPWTYIDEITSAAWEEEKLRLHKDNGGPLGWNSIRHLTVTLTKLLEYAVAKHYLENVPSLKAPPLKLIRGEKRPRRAMEAAEKAAFLESIREAFPVSHRFYTTLFWSGLRRGELFALTQRWVDRRGGWLVIPPEHSKSGQEEKVPLHATALEAIDAQIRFRENIDRDAPLWGEHDARPAWKHALAVTGIDPRGLVPHHVTRHTFATELGHSTRNRRVFMQVARMRSEAIVNTYVHDDEDAAKALIKGL